MLNSSLNATISVRPYPIYLEAICWIVCVLVSMETILGNLMVILAWKKDRSIQKHLSNLFIMSLAVSDMIIGLEGFPFFTAYILQGQQWPLSYAMCQLWLWIDYTLCLVSILTVLLITVDRYCSVCHPALYLKWQNPTKIKWLIAGSWVIPAVFFCFMILLWPVMSGAGILHPGECYAPFLSDPYVNMSMYLVYYWSVLVAMLILYRGIHRAANTLERKAEARDKQSFAILMGQKCMAQLGAGIVLQPEVTTVEPKLNSNKQISGSPSKENTTQILHQKDSGYITLTNPQTTPEQKQALEEYPDNNADINLKDTGSPHQKLDENPHLNLDQSPTDDGSLRLSLEPQCILEITDQQQRLLDAEETPTNSMDFYDGLNSAALSTTSSFRDSDLTSVLFMRFESIKQSRKSSHLSPSKLRLSNNIDENTQLLFEDPPIKADLPKVHSKLQEQEIGTKKLSSDTLNGVPQIEHSLSPAHKSSLCVAAHLSPFPSPQKKKRASFSDQVTVCKVDRPHRSLEDLAANKNRKHKVSNATSHIFLEGLTRSRLSTHTRKSRKELRRMDTGVENLIEAHHRLEQSTPTFTRQSSRSALSLNTQFSTSSSGSEWSCQEQIRKIHHDLNLRLEGAEDGNSKKSAKNNKKEKKIKSVETARSTETAHTPENTSPKRRNAVSMLFSLDWMTARRRKRTKAEKRARKAFRTITFIVGFFALFWSPYFVVATVYGFCEKCIPTWVFNLSYYMCYLNSSGNPFAYAMANRQFKIAFQRLLRLDFSRHS